MGSGADSLNDSPAVEWPLTVEVMKRGGEPHRTG